MLVEVRTRWIEAGTVITRVTWPGDAVFLKGLGFVERWGLLKGFFNKGGKLFSFACWILRIWKMQISLGLMGKLNSVANYSESITSSGDFLMGCQWVP